MTAFIGRQSRGVWVTNGERDDFLDWFAAHRCRPGDTRHSLCLGGTWRWPGCGVELERLLASDEALQPTAAELDEAGRRSAYLPQILDIVSRVAAGTWRHDVGSSEARWWRVPWLLEGFTDPTNWRQ